MRGRPSEVCCMMRRERALVLVAAAALFSGCTGSVGDAAGSRPPGNGTGGSGGRPPGSSTPGSSNPGTPVPGTPGAPPTPPGVAAEQPGRTPLRRLTRSQYNNTIRDLLGLSGD